MIKIISIFRTFNGLDDAYFYSHLNTLKDAKQVEFINFDDTTFVDFQTTNFASRLARKMVRKKQIGHFNEVIVDYIESFKPNFIVCFKAHNLLSSTVLLAKKRNIKIVVIYPDLEPKIHGNDYLKLLKLADLLIYTKPNLKDYFETLSANSICVNPFYASSQIKKIIDYDPNIGVSFIGHHSKDKQKLITALSESIDSNITIYGDRWGGNIQKTHRLHVHPAIYGPPVAEIYQKSLFVLGLLTERLDSFKDGDVITSRSVQISINGGLLTHPRNLYSEQFFGIENTMLFDTIESVCEIHKRLLNDLELRQQLFEQQQAIVIKKGTNIELLINNIINNFEKGNYNIFDIFQR